VNGRWAECRNCGHYEGEHRNNGACLCVVIPLAGDDYVCPCNEFEPSDA